MTPLRPSRWAPYWPGGSRTSGTFWNRVKCRRAGRVATTPLPLAIRLFSNWEARNVTLRRGGIAAASRVFGLRPVRADLSRSLKLPKDGGLTSAPAASRHRLDQHVDENLRLAMRHPRFLAGGLRQIDARHSHHRQ